MHLNTSNSCVAHNYDSLFQLCVSYHALFFTKPMKDSVANSPVTKEQPLTKLSSSSDKAAVESVQVKLPSSKPAMAPSAPLKSEKKKKPSFMKPTVRFVGHDNNHDTSTRLGAPPKKASTTKSFSGKVSSLARKAVPSFMKPTKNSVGSHRHKHDNNHDTSARLAAPSKKATTTKSFKSGRVSSLAAKAAPSCMKQPKKPVGSQRHKHDNKIKVSTKACT